MPVSSWVGTDRDIGPAADWVACVVSGGLCRLALPVSSCMVCVVLRCLCCLGLAPMQGQESPRSQDGRSQDSDSDVLRQEIASLQSKKDDLEKSVQLRETRIAELEKEVCIATAVWLGLVCSRITPGCHSSFQQRESSFGWNSQSVNGLLCACKQLPTHCTETALPYVPCMCMYMYIRGYMHPIATPIGVLPIVLPLVRIFSCFFLSLLPTDSQTPWHPVHAPRHCAPFRKRTR